MTTSPTAELRAAANILATLDSHPHGPGLLADLAKPVADWLEHAALGYEAAVAAAASVWDNATDAEAQAFIAKHGIEPHALAVARAILGGRP